MTNILVYVGLAITIFGAVLIGAGYYFMTEMEKDTREYDDKCMMTNGSKLETDECLDLNLRMANHGLYFLSLGCGGGVILVIGIIILIVGALKGGEKRQQPAPGYGAPPQYGYQQPPQYGYQQPPAYGYQPPPPGQQPPPGTYATVGAPPPPQPAGPPPAGPGPRNCPKCSAPVEGNFCGYCGHRF